MLLPPTGLFAVYEFYNKGFVNISYGIYLAIVFTLFSYFSSLYSVNIDDAILSTIFSIFTIKYFLHFAHLFRYKPSIYS